VAKRREQWRLSARGGLARHRAGGSVDGRCSGLTTTWCWRTAGGWVLGAPWTACFGALGWRR